MNQSHRIDLSQIEHFTARTILAASHSPVSNKRLEVVCTQYTRLYELYENGLLVDVTRFLYIAVQRYNQLP